MTRTEEITAKALENVNFDKYLLSNAVGKRAEELASGVKTLLDIDTTGMKNTDIALREIAEGKLTVSLDG